MLHEVSCRSEFWDPPGFLQSEDNVDYYGCVACQNGQKWNCKPYLIHWNTPWTRFFLVVIAMSGLWRMESPVSTGDGEISLKQLIPGYLLLMLKTHQGRPYSLLALSSSFSCPERGHCNMQYMKLFLHNTKVCFKRLDLRFLEIGIPNKVVTCHCSLAEARM